MVAIRPFKGFTPKPELADQIAALPYDVMSADEARAITQKNPLSFLRVEKSEVEFAASESPSKEAIITKGRDNLLRMIAEGLLIQDSNPCFYLYRQKMGAHVQIGLVAGASVEEYHSGTIKRHEFTRKDKEDERAMHVDLVNANAGPVFLTYYHRSDMDEFVSRCIAQKPDIDFVADDGISHTLWRISQPDQIQKIETIFQSIPTMYIADGHHRAAAAGRVQSARKSGNAHHTGNEEYNYFLTVIFPDNQMYIMDYNRVLKDTNGLSETQILDKLGEKFEVAKLSVSTAEEARPKKRNEFAMYLNGNWYTLAIHPDRIPNDPVDSLDASLLQNEVLEPMFDIRDPRTDNRIDFVGGIRGLEELVRRCQVDCKLAFALYPTGIDQLISVADSGRVMPPKSTWFEPKLRSGMVVKML